MLYVFAVAFLLIFIGELGDKSQLLALILATKYKPTQVLVSIFAATFTVHLLTSILGFVVGSAIPDGVMPWITGILFIGFGIWTLRGDKVEDDETVKASKWGPYVVVFVAFFIAELGDKTQLMTLAIAADPTAALTTYLKFFGNNVSHALSAGGVAVKTLTTMQAFWAVTLGSTLGMVAADAIAILVGRILGKRMPEKLITRISGIIFLLFGILAIASAVMK